MNSICPMNFFRTTDTTDTTDTTIWKPGFKTGEQRSKQTRLQRTTFRAPEAKSTRP